MPDDGPDDLFLQNDDMIAGSISDIDVPTPPTHTALPRIPVDSSGYTKGDWKLIHDPELYPKGSIGRSKPMEIRQFGQGVCCPLDDRLKFR